MVKPYASDIVCNQPAFFVRRFERGHFSESAYRLIIRLRSFTYFVKSDFFYVFRHFLIKFDNVNKGRFFLGFAVHVRLRESNFQSFAFQFRFFYLRHDVTAIGFDYENNRFCFKKFLFVFPDFNGKRAVIVFVVSIKERISLFRTKREQFAMRIDFYNRIRYPVRTPVGKRLSVKRQRYRIVPVEKRYFIMQFFVFASGKRRYRYDCRQTYRCFNYKSNLFVFHISAS